jgi:hypothetical protein
VDCAEQSERRGVGGTEANGFAGRARRRGRLAGAVRRDGLTVGIVRRDFVLQPFLLGRALFQQSAPLLLLFCVCQNSRILA